VLIKFYEQTQKVCHTTFRTRITLYDQSFLITISVVLGNGKGAALLRNLAAIDPDTNFSKQ
jgi:hypothetical protein